MTVNNKEIEDLKEGVRNMVLLFKALWDEVEYQFSELSREERHRIYALIAPILIDILAMAEGEETIEDITKPKGKNHGKKKR